MYGIELASGINNCYWNINKKCTNCEITRKKINKLFKSRDWDSKINCVYTILGVHLCHGYKMQITKNN